MLHAKIAAALKKIFTITNFKKNGSSWKSRKLKSQPISSRTTNRSHDARILVYCKYQSILDFSDLMNITLRGDDDQGVDAKWDEILLSMKGTSKDEILEKYAQNEAARFGTIEDHFCSVQSR